MMNLCKKQNAFIAMSNDCLDKLNKSKYYFKNVIFFLEMVDDVTISRNDDTCMRLYFYTMKLFRD